MTKQREYSYDSIKGILIILVIWGHWLEYGLSDSINLRLFNTIYLFHMPLFIAISGYFSRKKAKKDFIKTITDLFCTYSIVQIMYLLVRWFINGVEISFSAIYTPCAASWYLMSLIFWRIMLEVMPENLLKKKAFCLTLSFILAICAGFVPISKAFSFQRTLSFFPFFLCGYYYKQIPPIIYGRKIQWFSGMKKCLIISAVIITCLSFLLLDFRMQNVLFCLDCYYNQPYSELGMSLFRLIYLIAASLIAASILLSAPQIMRKNVFCIIGQNSLVFYVYHIPLLWIGMYMVRRYSLPLSFLPIIGYTIVTVLLLFFMNRYDVFHKLLHPYSFITKFF